MNETGNICCLPRVYVLLEEEGGQWKTNLMNPCSSMLKLVNTKEKGKPKRTRLGKLGGLVGVDDRDRTVGVASREHDN